MSTNTSSLHIFQILRLVTESREPLGVADVVRLTGLPTTTVYRALVTLEEADFLERDRTMVRYRIGLTPQFLALTLFNRYPLRDAALPLMRELADETGATVTLAVRLGWYAVRIAAVRGSDDVAYRAAVGAAHLLHPRRQLWTILMHMDDEELERYRRFIRTRYSELSARIDRSSFIKELRADRARGFVTLPADLSNGYQFAAPIRGPGLRPLGTIRILGGVLDSPEPVGDARITHWLAQRDALEARIAQDPKLFELPFSHIDPDSIQLRLTDE